MAVRTTLPGRDYHAAEVFDLERERIFARNWYYAGRDEALSEPGDYMTVDVLGESVIVLRGSDGGLRGFYNVCRHRGSRLCDEASGRMKGVSSARITRGPTRSTAASSARPTSRRTRSTATS
jgi:glycine betaine catabolism A